MSTVTRPSRTDRRREHCDAAGGSGHPGRTRPSLSERRPLGDRAFQIIALASGLLVLVILVLIAVSTTQQSTSWFTTEGWGIFGKTWNPAANQFGALAFIYGTAITSAIALVMAVPVSVGIALLLTEVVPYRWARPIVYVIDLLAVVPSVIWGLWGSWCSRPGSARSQPHRLGRQRCAGARRPVRAAHQRALVLHRGHRPGLHDHADRHLAVARGDRQLPAIDRGAYALGANRLEMITGAIGRTARAASPGPCCSASAAAMGETIAAALVIGCSRTHVAPVRAQHALCHRGSVATPPASSAQR